MAKKKCCKGKCSREKSLDEKPVENIEPAPENKPISKTNFFLELIKKNFYHE
jgi:hypothetical protein